MPRLTEARRDGRRAHILAAAEACFARLGFHRATMRDVVAEADLSTGCVYKHFRSKDEIVTAITTDRHLAEAALFEQAEEIDDPIEALRGLGGAFIRSCATPEGMLARRVGVQTWTEALLDDAMRARVLEGIELPVARIEKLVLRAQERGRLTQRATPQALARSFVSLFHGFVLQKLWQPELDPESYLTAMDVMLDGLVIPTVRR
jgi:AcrR family transcriptional regulator